MGFFGNPLVSYNNMLIINPVRNRILQCANYVDIQALRINLIVFVWPSDCIMRRTYISRNRT